MMAKKNIFKADFVQTAGPIDRKTPLDKLRRHDPEAKDPWSCQVGRIEQQK